MLKGGTIMNRLMSATVLILAAGALLLLAGCDRAGVQEDVQEDVVRPIDPNVVPPPGPPLQGDPSIQPAPVRTVLDEKVGDRWKAVEITVAEKKEAGQEFKIEIPIGGEAVVEGTPLKIKLLGFVPDFSMGADSIGTKSLDDVNPAAKIEVTEGEEVLFTGWSFRDFPGMHSFEDPRFSIALTRAIPVE
jgi:hypothetical protein